MDLHQIRPCVHADDACNLGAKYSLKTLLSSTKFPALLISLHARVVTVLYIGFPFGLKFVLFLEKSEVSTKIQTSIFMV